jgi:undecaprenyl-diphosphatase
VISLDQRVEGWVVDHRAQPFDTIFVALSHLGNYGLVWFVLAALVALLRRRPVVLPLVAAAYLVSWGVSSLLKDAVDRARPVDHPLIERPTSSSFPSGHATTSFACAATLAPFVSKGEAICLYVLAAAISYSRVYDGVHYPLDVLAGAALGLALARALRRLPEALRRSRPGPRPG